MFAPTSVAFSVGVFAFSVVANYYVLCMDPL